MRNRLGGNVQGTVKLRRYVPYVLALVDGQLKRRGMLPPGTVVELANKRYLVGMHQELRRVTPKGINPAKIRRATRERE
jgi:hypothetical protein